MHVPVIIDEQTSHTTANEGIQWNKNNNNNNNSKKQSNGEIILFYFFYINVFRQIHEQLN